MKNPLAMKNKKLAVSVEKWKTTPLLRGFSTFPQIPIPFSPRSDNRLMDIQAYYNRIRMHSVLDYGTTNGLYSSRLMMCT